MITSFLSHISSSSSSGRQPIEICAPSLDSPRAKEVTSSSSSREASPMNPKVLRDLEFMKSLHGSNSMVSVSLLNYLRTRYYISNEFDLLVPRLS